MKIREFQKKDLDECIRIIKETLGSYNAKKAKKDFLEGINQKTKEYSVQHNIES